MKVRQWFKNVFCGFLIGVCMLIPGVSGGTVAVILGLYDRILDAAASIFTKFKESLLLLSAIAGGGLLGFFAMAGVVGILLDCALLPTIYFFIGTILGGIVITLLEFDGKRGKIRISMLIFGAAVVLLLRLIPNGMFVYSDVSVWLRFLIMIMAGLLLGAAFILPGVSFSMTLMALGIYEDFLNAIERLDLRFLLPIVFSTLFGVIALSKLLSYFLRKYPSHCQSMILGFVIASLAELFPGLPQGSELMICAILMLFGFFLSCGSVFFIKRKRA